MKFIAECKPGSRLAVAGDKVILVHPDDPPMYVEQTGLVPVPITVGAPVWCSCEECHPEWHYGPDA